MAEKVILYTLPDCQVSDDARKDLRAEGVEIEERNVMKNQAWFDEALRYSIYVPIIVRGDKVEVGWKGALG